MKKGTILLLVGILAVALVFQVIPVDAKKSQGTSNPQYGSATNICGNSICDAPMSVEERIAQFLKDGYINLESTTNAFSFGGTLGETIDVSMNEEFYEIGERPKIFVNVGEPNIDVTFTLIDPENNQVLSKEKPSRNNGNVNQAIAIRWLELPGVYTVNVSYIHDDVEVKGSTTFSYGASADGTINAPEIITDKSSYQTGEIISYSGTVARDNREDINIEVHRPDGTPVLDLNTETNRDGTFEGVIGTTSNYRYDRDIDGDTEYNWNISGEYTIKLRHIGEGIVAETTFTFEQIELPSVPVSISTPQTSYEYPDEIIYNADAGVPEERLTIQLKNPNDQIVYEINTGTGPDGLFSRDISDKVDVSGIYTLTVSLQHDAENNAQTTFVYTISDADEDTIPDAVDSCPSEPETVNGFEDLDGCPDVAPISDEDNDGILSEFDVCPNEAEIINGFEDEDGCPDYVTTALPQDLDRDGFYGDIDFCPTEPETRNQYRDQDGCPEILSTDRDDLDDIFRDVDLDQDGIDDRNDDCPGDAENKNGFEDRDGCPDVLPPLDSDYDGITDPNDACVDERENINRYQDNDGCPDTSPEQLDTDGDGVDDFSDVCPNESEDYLQNIEYDGCPTFAPQIESQEMLVDFDNDNILENDLCPNYPENLNGVRDNDGCPDFPGSEYDDWDNDGVNNAEDICPNDGYNQCQASRGPDSDNDGTPDSVDRCPNDYYDYCPMSSGSMDVDNDNIRDSIDPCPNDYLNNCSPSDSYNDEDGDGIPDNEDNCSNELETWNGFEDEDGCSDYYYNDVTLTLTLDKTSYKIGENINYQIAISDTTQKYGNINVEVSYEYSLRDIIDPTVPYSGTIDTSNFNKRTDDFNIFVSYDDNTGSGQISKSSSISGVKLEPLGTIDPQALTWIDKQSFDETDIAIYFATALSNCNSSCNAYLEILQPDDTLYNLEDISDASEKLKKRIEIPITGYDWQSGEHSAIVTINYFSNEEVQTKKFTTPFTMIVDDSDGDGISNFVDNCMESNPDQIDSDDDGLGDVCERDSDNDRLSNSFEASIGTNPDVFDTDGDGLNDFLELWYGSNPLAIDPDSDGDGLQDILEEIMGTNPNVVDTDEDGWWDGEEGKNGTDPLLKDTDGDSINDPQDPCATDAEDNLDLVDGCPGWNPICTDRHLRGDLASFNSATCSYDNLNLSGLEFKDITLTLSDIKGANFDGATLTNANMPWGTYDASMSFAGATLNNLEINGNVENISFAGATLTNVKIDGNVDGASFASATLTDVLFLPGSISNVKFSDATLTDVTFNYLTSGTDLYFSYATLDNVVFGFNPNFEKKLDGNFKQASLHNVDFAGIDISGTDFTGAVLDNVNLDGANVDNVLFKDASIQCDGPTASDTTPAFYNKRSTPIAGNDAVIMSIGGPTHTENVCSGPAGRQTCSDVEVYDLTEVRLHTCTGDPITIQNRNPNTPSYATPSGFGIVDARSDGLISSKRGYELAGFMGSQLYMEFVYNENGKQETSVSELQVTPYDGSDVYWKSTHSNELDIFIIPSENPPISPSKLRSNTDGTVEDASNTPSKLYLGLDESFTVFVDDEHHDEHWTQSVIDWTMNYGTNYMLNVATAGGYSYAQEAVALMNSLGITDWCESAYECLNKKDPDVKKVPAMVYSDHYRIGYPIFLSADNEEHDGHFSTGTLNVSDFTDIPGDQITVVYKTSSWLASVSIFTK